ncbi:MAG: DNA gyrase inhibitor YacG [Terriglobia bacterium]
MRCPICHKDGPWAGNSFRPFCSERCQLIDLDHWLSERYRISTPVERQDKNRPTEEEEQDDKRGSG